MADLIRPEVLFTTLYGEDHRVGVTTEWGVVLDRHPAEQFLRPAGVLILGFANSLGTPSVPGSVLKREEFYETVIRGYDEAVSTRHSGVVTEIDNARNGTNIGGRLNTLTRTLASPFRTNVLQLSLGGVQKRLLICRDPADEDKVETIIKRSSLSDNPDVNSRLQSTLFESYRYQKRILLRKPGAYRKQPIQPRPPMGRSEDIGNGSTCATPRRRLLPTAHVTEVNANKSPMAVMVREYLPAVEVIRTAGEHIFGLQQGAGFSAGALMDILNVNPNDSKRVKEALIVLQREGFLKLTFRGDDAVYVRTDKQKS